MGTVYQTTCGCISSFPEPSPCEYDTREEYERAAERWAQSWQTDAHEHEARCPRSAYYLGPQCSRCGAAIAQIQADFFGADSALCPACAELRAPSRTQHTTTEPIVIAADDAMLTYSDAREAWEAGEFSAWAEEHGFPLTIDGHLYSHWTGVEDALSDPSWD